MPRINKSSTHALCAPKVGASKHEMGMACYEGCRRKVFADCLMTRPVLALRVIRAHSSTLPLFNHRPCKVLGLRIPFEVFFGKMGCHTKPPLKVALRN